MVSQASLAIHCMTLFSACVWTEIIWGGILYYKESYSFLGSVCNGQIGLGFQSLQLQAKEAIGQPVPRILLTSPCSEQYLLLFPTLQGGELKPRGCLSSRGWGLEPRAEAQPPPSTLWAPGTQQCACWHHEEMWNWGRVCCVPFILTGLINQGREVLFNHAHCTIPLNTATWITLPVVW